MLLKTNQRKNYFYNQNKVYKLKQTSKDLISSKLYCLILFIKALNYFPTEEK